MLDLYDVAPIAKVKKKKNNFGIALSIEPIVNESYLPFLNWLIDYFIIKGK